MASVVTWFCSRPRRALFWLWLKSVRAAANSQGLSALAERLREIVPDISKQYSDLPVEGAYLEAKVRIQQAFQMWLVGTVIEQFQRATVVDIGDSSGAHLQYLQSLYGQGRTIRTLSVNLDPKAVERIRAKGLEAVCAPAQDLERYQVAADIFLCFETLEHLTDPIRFLYALAEKTPARYFVATIPFLRRSRMGLHHIRARRSASVSAEEVHLFELCPADWKLLAMHAGWRVRTERVYLQYPRWHPMWLTKFLWRKLDFEGFYGMVLEKDNSWSKKYADW